MYTRGVSPVPFSRTLGNNVSIPLTLPDSRFSSAALSVSPLRATGSSSSSLGRVPHERIHVGIVR